jgi:hypothetical protein
MSSKREPTCSHIIKGRCNQFEMTCFVSHSQTNIAGLMLPSSWGVHWIEAPLLTVCSVVDSMLLPDIRRELESRVVSHLSQWRSIVCGVRPGVCGETGVEQNGGRVTGTRRSRFRLMRRYLSELATNMVWIFQILSASCSRDMKFWSRARFRGEPVCRGLACFHLPEAESVGLMQMNSRAIASHFVSPRYPTHLTGLSGSC